MAGHGRTPSLRSGQRWVSNAVRGRTEALGTHSSHSRACSSAEVPRQTRVFEDQGTLRRAYKQNLFEEAKTWKGHPPEARLKSLIMLDDENDDQPRRLISRERIDNDRRHYEYYAENRQPRKHTQPFSVYGTPEFHDLDVLKLWVNSNQHTRDTWPLAIYTKEH